MRPKNPVHWGADAEITDSAMAATLRGGLSLGLCGFTFWSHDIGAFTQKSPEELYARWTPFGMLRWICRKADGWIFFKGSRIPLVQAANHIEAIDWNTMYYQEY